VRRWPASSPGAAAKCPVIAASGGAHLLGATEELAGLSDILGIAVGTMNMGKGAFDETAKNAQCSIKRIRKAMHFFNRALCGML
jgi:thiamine pyrophosphate-dependent acetolactate synthase large subunit-like protein